RFKIGHHLRAIGWQQPFGRYLADLRRVEADPDFSNLRPSRPETQKFFEVARAGDLLARDRAVHNDLVADDVCEDAVVSGWGSPYVMLGLQTIDGDGNRQLGNRRPFFRDFTNRAGDELGMD